MCEVLAVRSQASVSRLFLLVAWQTAIVALLLLTAFSVDSAWMFVVGIIATALVFFVGLHVRKAIGTRIRSLVENVRCFQESGVYARIADTGRDDIAVLSNALDAGLYAIASREK